MHFSFVACWFSVVFKQFFVSYFSRNACHSQSILLCESVLIVSTDCIILTFFVTFNDQHLKCLNYNLQHLSAEICKCWSLSIVLLYCVVNSFVYQLLLSSYVNDVFWLSCIFPTISRLFLFSLHLRSYSALFWLPILKINKYNAV